MPTKDALFGRKKKDIRVFPDFTGGSESVLPRAITKGGYSVFDEVPHSAYCISMHNLRGNLFRNFYPYRSI
jgi:hypothetical protein